MTSKGFLEQPQLHTEAPFRSAMLTYPGNFKEALRQAQADPKKTLFGVAHGIPSVFVTKLIASTQPDFIWIDAEHAIFDRLTLFDAVQAAQHHSEGKSMVVVRVMKGDVVSMATCLDAGAAAIVLPHCESAREVQEVLKEIYYPPLGQRSFSPWIFTPGISDRSLYPEDAFNIRTSNEHVAVFAQIESVKGVENVEEIAALDGVAGLMFGPGDYSIDAGLPLKLGGEPHPTFIAAMTKFVTAAKTANKPLIGAAQVPALIPMMIDQGYRAIAVAFDYWGFATMLNNDLKGARKKLEETIKIDGEAEVAVNGKA